MKILVAEKIAADAILRHLLRKQTRTPRLFSKRKTR